MSTSQRELVSKRTRECVRDQMSSTVLRVIDDMWQDELFARALDDESRRRWTPWA